MVYLLMGLMLFLGVHSTRAVADDWRSRQVAKLGDKGWKGAYSLLSLAGFALLIWGYGQARAQPVVLWVPPVAARHAAALLTLVAFMLWAASHSPRSFLKAKVHHPMLAGTAIWAAAHLLANGTLADAVLFGAFLVWSLMTFLAAVRRDRAAGVVYAAGAWAPTLGTLVGGAVVWAVFALGLHKWLVGVSPLG